jgi:hypothetical protein
MTRSANPQKFGFVASWKTGIDTSAEHEVVFVRPGVIKTGPAFRGLLSDWSGTVIRFHGIPVKVSKYNAYSVWALANTFMVIKSTAGNLPTLSPEGKFDYLATKTTVKNGRVKFEVPII